MKHTLNLFLLLLVASNSMAGEPYKKYPSISNEPFNLLDTHAYKKENIKEIIKKTAEYQLEKYGENNPTKDWLVGTFFSSFVAAYETTQNPWYLKQATKWAEQSEWDIHKHWNADDVCPAQTYLDLYFIKPEKKRIKNIEEKLKVYLTQTEIEPYGKDKYQKKTMKLTGRNLWSWCDALYMAPPVFARMGKATNDKAYFEKLHALYSDSKDFLYDPSENLFFRNSKEKTEKLRTPNGKKVFWSRGNGWVIGGLARLIEFIPENDSMKQNYKTLFQDLAYGIAKYQMPDGLWRSSLNDPEWITSKETSGSAFFIYAIAKGINEGWLPKEYFFPTVLKGWSGLMSCVSPEGRLGYSQIVAGSPHEVRAEDSKDYAVGAFILAATEMLKLEPEQEMYTLMQKEFEPRLVAKDGAWTWYNDERVIFHNNIFYASYVKHDGASAYTAYSVEKWSSCHARKEKILSTWRYPDDHNNAALLPLLDNKILACYATHGKKKGFNQRKITVPRWNECKLSEEKTHNVISTRKGLTYNNLMRLSDENNRIYNFFRGNNFNPNFVYSDDDAETWSEPIWLISAGNNSNQRPYVKYISNGKDRIDFLYTDGHPRNEPENCVYHFYYKKGVFYNSKGKKLRTIEQLKSKPIALNEGTMIFDGTKASGRGWVHDLEYDEKGNPHAAFISSPSGDIGTDIRYWTASFDGKKWHNEEIAFAGSNLYPKEQHYAGGIALNPGKANTVVISSNVNPKTGEALPNGKYQLFKGVKKENQWTWIQLTHDPVFNHLRPVIVRGEKNALFWFTGDYHTFLNYHTDVMMSYTF